MERLKDIRELKKIREYKPGEVYKIKDKFVTMTRDESTIPQDKDRYILIVSSEDLAKNYNTVNVVPLSKSGFPDLYSYPLHKEYSDKANNFDPSEKSLAVIKFYQPIKKEYVGDYCGTIMKDRYNSIALAICHYVVGVNSYDLEP